MLPTLRPGKIIIGAWPLLVKIDDIVVVRHGGLEKVKRVKYLDREKMFLVGDNPAASTDSRDFGWVETRCIIAKVVQF